MKRRKTLAGENTNPDVIDISSNEHEVSGSSVCQKQSNTSSVGDNCDNHYLNLVGDPDKLVEVANDTGNGSDEVLIVGEKEQIAGGGYTHARHLCAKFPFSTNQHEKYCDLCHCYVCDTRAPCIYWGTGASSGDHCHSNDKDKVWRLERECFKQGKMPQLSEPKFPDDEVIPLSELIPLKVKLKRMKTRVNVKRSKTMAGANTNPEVIGISSDDEEVSGSSVSQKQSNTSSVKDNCDDDCLILVGDPDKPVEVVNDTGNGSDELLIVSEKGKIACRDYPHARHLCARFPFSTNQHEKYCDLCHCYVCDTRAPCIYWGTGTSSGDHCHSSDKEEVWRLKRKCFKQDDQDKIPLSELMLLKRKEGFRVPLPCTSTPQKEPKRRIKNKVTPNCEKLNAQNKDSRKSITSTRARKTRRT